VGVYFQSQDGETFYEEVIKWHKTQSLIMKD
jgi:hypothetical protein